MYRELGLLAVLLLPVILIYLSRNEHLQPKTKSKKSKKKNKKKTKSTEGTTTDNNNNNNNNNNGQSTRNNEGSSITGDVTVQKDLDSISSATIVLPTTSQDETKALNTTTKTQQQKKKGKGGKKQHQTLPKSEFPPLPTSSPPPSTTPQQQEGHKEREIDEHMDNTVRYSRVMRIRTEPATTPLTPVPYEEGWDQVKVKPNSSSSSSIPQVEEPLTKKQRYNRTLAARKKEAKAQADALQAQRLRQHQRELEKEKIAAFYKTGAGKHTPWGAKPIPGSSKVPTGKAGLNEHGQLIWD
ncbi:uncharacterized protein BX664DRAFT_337598 [Halteromyces radiatus]|uniref:uncharacterized protein n=1 Tax=Halteromyces radiatus TaxID=101107 RepID=UPI00222072DF|nr:uncharacterized protein BX664DRAFT_337598 [Halteromyces radiatus]KAI8084709.1 hypothetical protein BX664DRAFT_337598 [Halteromyces radiatus]